MSLSDCIKCWNTPCTCGSNFQRHQILNLEEKYPNIEKMIDKMTNGGDAEMKNIQIDYSTKIILLDNMMQRMRELKNGGFALDGVITQAERNAMFLAFSMLQRRRDELKVGGDENGI